MAKEASGKIPSNALVIVDKDDFPILGDYPIDSIGDLYERVEKLASWFVLRAPLSEVTKLANPTCIEMFRDGAEPSDGSRNRNRVAFDDEFLRPLSLDCTQFEFVYTRRQIKGSLETVSLDSNSSDVFERPSERAAVFVGKNSVGKEDSCIESICRHVRNAFAHGRIAVNPNDGEPLVFLEDGCCPRKVHYEGGKTQGEKLEVRMRMVVKLSTLEKWYGRLIGR